jgi:protein dpy-30
MMTEWERLQEMPDSEYLMRTVLPVLYQGMSIVDLERPSAPLEFLALYLLKNQDQVKLPPKAVSSRVQE